MLRQIVQSGLLEAYRLDAAAALAFVLIGMSVYRTVPELIWGYAGVVLLGTVVMLGKVQAKHPGQKPD